jgi:hypothetical protein
MFGPGTARTGLVVALALGIAAGRPAAGPRADLPAQLAEPEFWSLTETLSEPGGSFHSDNFVSNESGFQRVLPALTERVRRGSVYLGVGPEQNFTYIAALQPRAAFIIDIRRGNLQEHLLYKALFQMSADRVEFVARLFSRPRPLGLGTASTPDQIFAAFARAATGPDEFDRNQKAVQAWFTRHAALRLHSDDWPAIRQIYAKFFAAGPSINYVLNLAGGTSGRGVGSPTYAQLMTADDGRGRQRSFLATEEAFRIVKGLQERNMIVPVVGNFAGPKAIRAVAQYLERHGAVVGAFYVSNVEQYLELDNLWQNFCRSVATLPLDAGSTFIRSVRGGRTGRAGFESSVAPIRSEVQSCAAR